VRKRSVSERRVRTHIGFLFFWNKKIKNSEHPVFWSLFCSRREEDAKKSFFRFFLSFARKALAAADKVEKKRVLFPFSLLFSSFYTTQTRIARTRARKQTNKKEMVRVFPGDRIRAEDIVNTAERSGAEIECGSGVYEDENNIKRASKIGEICVKEVEIEEEEEEEMEEEEDDDDYENRKKGQNQKKRKLVVEVLNEREIEDESARVRLPKVNDIVFAKCTKIRDKLAQFDVLVCDGKPLKMEFSGIVRQQDVRKTEIDKVVMEESFVPGDVVRCKVLAMGDGRSLVLTTNENPLGVVRAKCQRCKATMVAMNWQEMMCPKTEHRELRKVAKIDEIKDM